ncbi:MAG: FKBP-type peptidyl-prolyl cis-trans isomerase [Candidatus Aenigmarchaeota archaeon]|nr:FKBP-type peptidyl-prolyl cis-trans isomerase [Candidatus Aenigmarchaeota archaeon]
MNSGDFVYINYVGRIKDSGEIFDLTREDVAKKENVFNQNFKYKPVPIIVDADFILPGLNEALKEMKVKEKRKVEIKPEKAFGERNPELVKLIPEAKFKEQNIKPEVGSIIVINGIKGRVISISGGRVRVDFNHPLAGKTLEYELEIVKKIEDKKEKIEAIVFYFTSIEKESIDVKLNEKEVEIEFKIKYNLTTEVKSLIARTIKKWISGIEKIKFVDIFE